MRFSVAVILFVLLLPAAAFADADGDALMAINRHDYPTALKIWQPLADQGNMNAEYNIGLMYQNGEGVMKNDVTAITWYRKAAELGDERAQSNLGLLYLQGKDVAHDNSEGMKWLLKAAKQGYAIAQYNIGVTYEDGREGSPDFAQAMTWYRRAADQGEPKSQFAIGLMYDMGEDVAQDHAEALKWYRKAADHGLELAQAALILAEAPPTTAKPLSCGEGPLAKNSLLYSYLKKSQDDPDIYSIVAYGNDAYMVDKEMNPESPKDLAAHIVSQPAFERAKIIELDWPYSGWGEAPYAHALEKVTHKPVVGLPGPVWWYPDGTVISSYAERSTLAGPNEANVARCKTGDGKLHEEAECKAILKSHDNSQAIFGNLRFMLTCDEVRDLGEKAKSGDAEANMRLYFFNTLANIDNSKAAKYLEKAAFGGFPPANYLIAVSMLNASPPHEDLYLKFLTNAAEGGGKAAAKELETAQKKFPTKGNVSDDLPKGNAKPDPGLEVVLLTPEDVVGRNITVKRLGDAIASIFTIVEADTKTQTESFSLAVQVVLSPTKKADVKLANHYKGDQQKIKATLQSISDDLAKQPLPNTASDPISFQIIYHVNQK